MKCKRPKMEPHVNWIFEFFKEKIEDIERLLIAIQKKENKMAQTVQDLQNAITAVDTKVDKIASQITDLASDFDAAITKLEADIAAGVDLTSSVSALSALSDKLDAASAGLAAIDVKAETTSGTPTP